MVLLLIEHCVYATPMKPGLDELEVFLDVAAAKSISRAARSANVSTSTLSRAITRLEERMGVALLRRLPRGELLTPAGRRLFEQSRDHIRALREITAGFAEDDGAPRGRLRITAPPDFGRLFLAELLVDFARAYPQLQIETDYTMRVVDLIGEDYDAGLRVTAQSFARSSLVAHRLSAFRAQLYASPEYVASHPPLRRVSDLEKHRVLGLFRGPDNMMLMNDGERAVRIRATANLWMNDTYAMREAARHGGGIVTLPAYLAQNDLERGTLVRVLPKVRSGEATVYFVHPPVSPVPQQVKLLREALTPLVRKLL